MAGGQLRQGFSNRRIEREITMRQKDFRFLKEMKSIAVDRRGFPKFVSSVGVGAVIVPSLRAGLASLKLLDFLRQSRDDFEKIAHNAVSCDLENRRFLVFVDGHNRMRTLHPHHVLDSA